MHIFRFKTSIWNRSIVWKFPF